MRAKEEKKEKKRAKREKTRSGDKNKKRGDSFRIMCIFFVKLKYSNREPYENINMSITKKM